MASETLKENHIFRRVILPTGKISTPMETQAIVTLNGHRRLLPWVESLLRNEILQGNSGGSFIFWELHCKVSGVTVKQGMVGAMQGKLLLLLSGD